jgi:hypothetical protein
MVRRGWVHQTTTWSPLPNRILLQTGRALPSHIPTPARVQTNSRTLTALQPVCLQEKTLLGAEHRTRKRRGQGCQILRTPTSPSWTGRERYQKVLRQVPRRRELQKPRKRKKLVLSRPLPQRCFPERQRDFAPAMPQTVPRMGPEFQRCWRFPPRTLLGRGSRTGLLLAGQPWNQRWHRRRRKFLLTLKGQAPRQTQTRVPALG